MWSFNSVSTTNRLFAEAQSLQEGLLNRSLKPIQKAFADVSLPLLTNGELRQYILLAGSFNNVTDYDLTDFLDKLYKRLHPQSSPQTQSFIFERILIRCSLIILLLLLIKGFQNYNYYSICSFGVLFGSLLLFWLECKRKAYWTIAITFIPICVYNPIYKAHFPRIQWIGLDQKLVALLCFAIVIDFIVVYFKKFKLPKFKGVKLKIFSSNRISPRLHKFNMRPIGPWLWYALVLILVLCFCYFLWPPGFSNNFYIPSTPEQPVRSGNLVSDSNAHPSNLKDSIKTPADPYVDWDTVAYKTGSRPSGFKFNSQYGKINAVVRVTVGGDFDAVIKLINIKTNKCIRYVYVKAYDSFEISHIPLGEYTIKVAMGQIWKQKLIKNRIVGRFTANAIYKKGNETLNFYTDRTIIHGYDLKLNVQSGSNNFATSALSEDEFNN